MRTIKFRGKNNKGIWLYGDLLHNRGETFIAPGGIANPLATAADFLINPETVGQFTGLLDTNGREIYEGDIVDYVCDGQQQGIIIYDDFGCVSIEFGDDRYVQTIDLRLLSLMEIIGNIHDNPELLTEK